MTEPYAALVAREAYFWAWPLVNLYSRRLAFESPTDSASTGSVANALVNRLGMLTDYISAEERAVACPNQDLVCGGSSLALDRSAVVVQVPDFGSRFWVYQVVDARTDAFASLGSMYGTKPGFYLLVGPTWHGTVPPGISHVFRAMTNTGFIIPRVYREDSAEDKQAVQSVLQQITIYPLAEFDGKFKLNDGARQPKPSAPGEREQQWVAPEKFFDVLPRVLADAPPLPGEEARYAEVMAVVGASRSDRKLKEVIQAAAVQADAELVQPLLQFRDYGLQLPYHWSTVSNGADFGTDYFTRTAVARSNIFINRPEETKYYYQDLDADGQRLNGAHRYTITFAKGLTPPVRSFWSLTLYNEHHFFVPNELNRYSVGTKSRELKLNPDKSLTIYVQATPPSVEHRGNWLPAPQDRDFSLYLRAYWPKSPVLEGSWTPPPVRLLH
ncbi:MAG TPA: DUF1214 domain-containing protein [Polyangiaceae bacterium]|nr:DUF1214 domain-containing protein [Polyangiaceae bacterium]